MYAPGGEFRKKEGGVLGGVSNMSDAALRQWEELVSARE